MPTRYRLYVLVCQRWRARRGSRGVPTFEEIYVGHTAKDVETRAAEHRAEDSATYRSVELASSGPRFDDRAEAQRAERELARMLRGRGYVVRSS